MNPCHPVSAIPYMRHNLSAPEALSALNYWLVVPRSWHAHGLFRVAWPVGAPTLLSSLMSCRSVAVSDGPELDGRPQFSRSAADTGTGATLRCRAAGVPNVTFEWSKGGVVIDGTIYQKYRLSHAQARRKHTHLIDFVLIWKWLSCWDILKLGFLNLFLKL